MAPSSNSRRIVPTIVISSDLPHPSRLLKKNIPISLPN
jgi:hypothetical protein